MKNLFDRSAVDVATIAVDFNPEIAQGFKSVRGEYFAAYNQGHNLIVEDNKISGRYAVNFIYPETDEIKVNEAFFVIVNGNPSELGLLLDVIFAAKGLHTQSNTKVNAILKTLALSVHDLPECTLAEKQMHRHANLSDYVFDIYYRNTVKMLRVYNIPKQGYLDFEI